MAHRVGPLIGDVIRKPIVLLLALAAAVAALLKRQRDRELDEAIWEEAREV